MIVIYARQSVDKKDSISIESQIDFCKKEVSGNEYRVFIDKGFSGSNTQRPEFEKLIQLIKDGNVSKVIVYKLDRISRSILDFANIINLLKQNNVEFISATEKFDTSTPMGNAMLNITMVFAQLERETIQKRIKDNYYARGKKGFFMGGKTPYGYIKEPTTIDGIKTSLLAPHKEESVYLLKMFEMYSTEDISLGKLSSHLNERGIKAPNGGNWESLKISRILRNPVYSKSGVDVYMYFKNKGCIINNDISQFIGENGCYLYGKRDRGANKFNNIENHVLSLALHKGLVDSNTWLSCQYRLDNNKQIKNSGRGKHTWLSGLSKCGYCGYAMSVYRYKNYKYFMCRGKTNYKTCTVKHKTHYVEDIEFAVKEELLKKTKAIKNYKHNNKQEEGLEINKLKLDLINTETKINNLIDQMAQSNSVVLDYVNKKIIELDSQKNGILAKIKEHSIKNTTNHNKLFSVAEYADRWDGLNLEERKELAKTFIDKVLITNDEVNIQWK